MGRNYSPFIISVSGNRKTEFHIDVTKGCIGCKAHDKGCYNSCYAYKMATMAGVDFTQTVHGVFDESKLDRQLSRVAKKQDFIRVGVVGDPSEHWDNTVKVAKVCNKHNIKAIVTTKVWINPHYKQLKGLVRNNSYLHISTSAFDSRDELERRKALALRYKFLGGNIVVRIISAPFKSGSYEEHTQNNIVKWCNINKIPFLETPLRTFKTTAVWKRIDESKMKHHISIFNDKPDSQLTGGFILTDNKSYQCHACKDCVNKCMPIFNSSES